MEPLLVFVVACAVAGLIARLSARDPLAAEIRMELGAGLIVLAVILVAVYHPHLLERMTSPDIYPTDISQ